MASILTKLCSACGVSSQLGDVAAGGVLEVEVDLEKEGEVHDDDRSV